MVRYVIAAPPPRRRVVVVVPINPPPPSPAVDSLSCRERGEGREEEEDEEEWECRVGPTWTHHFLLIWGLTGFIIFRIELSRKRYINAS